MHGKYPCIFYFRAMYCDKLFAQTGFIIIKKTGVTKMTEEIYGDVLFLINFSMDFLSLFITGKIMHLKLKAWRVLVAASIGGVYGVEALFFPFDGIPLVFANIACAAVMCFIAFRSKGKISSVFLCCLLFYGVGILKSIRDDGYVIALAIDGKNLDSVELSEKIDKLGLSGKSNVYFVIGGSLGLSDAVMKRADYKLSFSRMTFPHQLMRVILLEQIYRSYRIINHEPYHK